MLLGLIGGIFYVLSVTLRTMIPLRIAAIISNVLFMGYGLHGEGAADLLHVRGAAADQRASGSTRSSNWSSA